MYALRRFAVGAAALALAGLGVVGFGHTPASAAPNFQVPFKCGETVTAATFDGHSPANSVDFQKDGITGMPVLASSSGTVSRVDDEGDTSYGKWIEIDHGSGWTTRYAHLSTQEVSEGQSVSLGTKIGEAGSTGGVTGPHLHYEQRSGGSDVPVVLDGTEVPYPGHTDFTSKNNCGGNPYTPEEVCGSGYSVIDSAKLGSEGTAYLLYNSGKKSNCVTTLKAKSLGTASPVSAFLEVKGAQRVTDSGKFEYYAGPVAKAAGSQCVKWGGEAGSESYTSPFEHCD